MSTPKALLKSVAKAFVKYAGNAVGFGFAGDVLVDLAPEIVGDIWDSWAKNKETGERQAELEAVLQASAADLRQQIAEVVADVASDQPPEVRQATIQFLAQVPATMRKSLRRPSDPTGATITASLLPTKADDLLAYLPSRLPRFKAGDHPLTGVDWELQELLGVGGFGEVWKAHNPHFDGVAPVALKFCLDPAQKERLLRHEAAILNRVMREGKHPGIVQLQNTFLAADPPCLAYEFIDGGDLAGVIQQLHAASSGPTHLQAAKIVLRLAEIVGFAHRLNPPIVHRDLKPANVLVQTSASAGPQFKIADFGIGGLAASRAVGQATTNVSEASMRMTSLSGACTPLYASPQQLRGLPPDPRDDVYALGVIWLQVLTGDLTTGRPGGSRWRQKLIDDGMSRPLVELLEACFEEAPDDRPEDAAALAVRLTELAADKQPARISLSAARSSAPISSAPPTVVQPAIQRGDELHCFEGHTKAVLSLAFSSDGRRLLSGSRDRTLRLWDVASGRSLRTFEGHSDAVYCLAVSPQGNQALSGSKDQTFRLWDLDTGQELKRLAGHSDTVYGVIFLPGGKSALSCGGDATLRQWNLASGCEERVFRGTGDRIYCLALSPTGERVLFGCEDHSLRLWDVKSGKEIACLQGHSGSILSVSLAADARHALSGSMDKTVRLWDLKKGRELAHFDPGIGAVASVAISADGSHALCGGIDRTVRLWRMKPAQEVHRFQGHTGQVVQVAFSPAGKHAVSASHDATARLWELRGL